MDMVMVLWLIDTFICLFLINDSYSSIPWLEKKNILSRLSKNNEVCSKKLLLKNFSLENQNFLLNINTSKAIDWREESLMPHSH